ncbi:MAG: hypothetical protein ACXW1Y_06305, partial [Acidimicrobiia bacterium]
MRPLEVALLVFAGLYPVAGFAMPRLQGIHVIPFVAVAIAIVHLIVEEYRWQMVPVYLVVGIMARVAGRLVRKPPPGLQIVQ